MKSPNKFWRDPLLVAASLVGVPTPRPLSEMRPDALDVIHMDNDAIDEVADSAIAAENSAQIPRTDFGYLTPEQIAEGDECNELR